MTSAIKKEVIIQDCRLLLGDALEIVPYLGPVDSTVTDPPYGVNLGDVVTGQAIAKNQQAYNAFSDTPEYIQSVVVKIIEHCISLSSAVAATTGNRNMFMYPQPIDMGVWWNPAGTSRGKWGFNCMVTPILYWGKDPYAGRGSFPSSPVGIGRGGVDKSVDHPCPKPLKFMEWLVNRASLTGQMVLDPFMGSGTTGLACIKLGRKFTGIEIDPEYFEIACKRIEDAYRQGDLFVEPSKAKPEPIQGALV